MTQAQTEIWTVAELTAYVKRLMDHDDALADVIVRGEISNLRRPSSGHMYFSLKDDQALLHAVCFRGQAGALGFDPTDGMSVVAGGNVTVYEPQGRYQIIVRFMRPDGVGALAAAFEKLKDKLEKEGLFAPERKRPLPRFPRTIALVTSDTGAAVRDMLSILGSRHPLAKIKLIPTLVQGQEAAPSIVRSLQAANAVGADVIILGRGGGSLEDLWSFNEEPVARAVFASRVPVISAVGHETDYVLTDFVADMRAATPSHAAEMAVPDARELLAYVGGLREQYLRRLQGMVQQYRLRSRATTEQPALRRPEMIVESKLQRLDDLQRALTVNARQFLRLWQARLDTLQARLSALDPDAALRRGYSIVRRADDGRLVTSVAALSDGDGLLISVSDGEVVARVSGIEARP